jgi:hypothetical protein
MHRLARARKTAARRACAATFSLVSVLCLTGCTSAEIESSDGATGAPPSTASVPGATAEVARKQNWNGQRIERAIANLFDDAQAAKARAEKEQEQLPQTMARMIARLSGPPGAGNAALADFEETRSKAGELNHLLREKGCASYEIDAGKPAFLRK